MKIRLIMSLFCVCGSVSFAAQAHASFSAYCAALNEKAHNPAFIGPGGVALAGQLSGCWQAHARIEQPTGPVQTTVVELIDFEHNTHQECWFGAGKPVSFVQPPIFLPSDELLGWDIFMLGINAYRDGNDGAPLLFVRDQTGARLEAALDAGCEILQVPQHP